MPRGQIISCLKSCMMISKGCLYHVVRVKDLECETPSIESVPVLREFPEFLPNDHPRVPPEQKIDFGIHLLPDTNPISIPPYRIYVAELKEMKLQLKN